MQHKFLVTIIDDEGFEEVLLDGVIERGNNLYAKGVVDQIIAKHYPNEKIFNIDIRSK